MIEDIWKVKETSEVWMKKWIGYDQQGKSYGGTIIVENGSDELIEAIQLAFDDTEGRKSK